jgi:hypothetical protein
MKRITYILAAAVPAGFALNAFAAYAYDLTGEQFMQMMSHPEPLSSLHYMEREKAYSYLDGAKDATVGVLWCPPKPRKTFEVAYEAADRIRAMPLAEQKQNAAKILVSLLSEQYPCQKGVRK